MTSLIPLRAAAWLAAASAALLAFHFWVKSIEARGYERCQSAHNEALVQANARSQAEEFSRRARQADIDRSTHAQAQLDRSAADAVRAPAGRVFDRLAAGCGGAVPGDPAASAVAEAASDAARVRSIVLGEIKDRLGALARAADERGTAGRGAERAYDSLSGER